MTNVKVWRRDCDALDGGVHEKRWWLPLPLRRHVPHQVAFYFQYLWRVFLAFGPREEFEEMFDTTAYERVRTKYHAEGWENHNLKQIIFFCSGAFPHLYDKTIPYYNIIIFYYWYQYLIFNIFLHRSVPPLVWQDQAGNWRGGSRESVHGPLGCLDWFWEIKKVFV